MLPDVKFLRSFLSTLPARGATNELRALRSMLRFLSTLPARGATPYTDSSLKEAVFLSTLPARGATERPRKSSIIQKISIHAPREGSDQRGR